MRVLTIVHEDDAGPGVFADVLSAGDIDLDTWFVAEQPRPPADATDYDAILSFGGAVHPHQEDQHAWLAMEKHFLADALAREIPLLGICLGAELIAEAAGGSTRHMPVPEIGWCDVSLTREGRADAVLAAVNGEAFEGLEWHSYAIELPAEATVLARSAKCIQGYRVGRWAWGLQFHAEVSDADFQYWLDHYTMDEDAVRVGIDPERIARETAPRMPAWHELGRRLCARFLEAAATR